jgi:hypothetical protein
LAPGRCIRMRPWPQIGVAALCEDETPPPGCPSPKPRPRQVVDLSALIRRECRLDDHPLAPPASTPPLPLRRPSEGDRTRRRASPGTPLLKIESHASSFAAIVAYGLQSLTREFRAACEPSRSQLGQPSLRPPAERAARPTLRAETSPRALVESSGSSLHPPETDARLWSEL